MFPKGQQKKKDTVVVMVDGKSPQTIPTMDSPPEPQKIPKCRLLVLLTVILIVALLLLAGYCAWLFFSYETDILPFKQTHDPDFIVRPTGTSDNNNHQTTSPPILKEEFFANHQNDDNFIIDDFGFSESSVESVYDSSEPYGSSESYPSIIIEPSSYSDHQSYSSLGDTTNKEDRYLWDESKKPLIEKIRGWRNREPAEESSESYYPADSSWFMSGNSNELPFDNSDSESWWPGWRDSGNVDLSSDSASSLDDSSRFSSELGDFIQGDVSGLNGDYYEESYSILDEDDSSSEDGSGSFSSYYDVFENFGDFIPQRVTPPAIIDALPPERIEVSVCSWPSRIFERNKGESDLRLAQLTDRLSCVYDNSFSITSIDEEDGTTISRTILGDFDNSIIAMNIKSLNTRNPTSVCYISFFPNVPEMETTYNDYSSGDYSGDYDSWDDEIEGSGTQEQVDSLGKTVVIKNPILLGGDLQFMSRSISDFCSTSTKFWASSISVKTRPQ